jgi:3-isopropylmalate dehydrogenase
METKKIVLLPGDGVGPEVVAEAFKVLQLVVELRAKKHNLNFEFDTHLIGGCAIDATGSPFPPATLEACKSASAILLGSVGGPQWPKADGARPEQGLLSLRKDLGLFANIRPCLFPGKSLMSHSPLKPEIIDGVLFTVVRELTGGIYFGKRQETTNGVGMHI